LRGWLRARRPYLVVRPVKGLANRMRGVTSGLAVARALGLPFAIHWDAGPGFSTERFQELFANDFELWDQERYAQALAGGAPVVSRWLGWKDAVPPAPDFEPRRALREIRRRGLVYDHAFHDLDRMLDWRGVPRLRAIRRERRRCCRELAPAAPIAARVDAFAREHFAGRPVVGVHVRRGDALASRRAEQHRVSSDEAFAEAMAAEVARDPAIRFFLSTDCDKTQRAFAERFPGRVVFTPKEFPESVLDAPKRGQADALVDMLLLSRTRYVLGTHASTFGLMAAKLSGIRFRPAGGQSRRSSASLSR
jgi:hypothetical protein